MDAALGIEYGLAVIYRPHGASAYSMKIADGLHLFRPFNLLQRVGCGAWE